LTWAVLLAAADSAAFRFRNDFAAARIPLD
jgi:hypothetical protein